jgi:hypothetical protein
VKKHRGQQRGKKTDPETEYAFEVCRFALIVAPFPDLELKILIL